jgi:hypothetical protein
VSSMMGVGIYIGEITEDNKYSLSLSHVIVENRKKSR